MFNQQDARAIPPVRRYDGLMSAEREFNVLGMALDVDEDDDLAQGQPVGALVIVKYLDQDGDVCYSPRATDMLGAVEAMGMLRYSQLMFEKGFMEACAAGDDD